MIDQNRIIITLSDRLGHQEEVASLRKCDMIINDGATGRIVNTPLHPAHDPGVDLLVDDDVGELDLVLLQTSLSHALEDGGDLVIDHVLNLSFTNTIPETR